MSSWLRAKAVPKRKPIAIPAYHDTASSPDIASIYLEFMAAYAYSQKMSETCNVWDPSGIINLTLKYNPQIRLLKEKPENSRALTLGEYSNLTATMKFGDIKRFATNVFQYDPEFNQTVIKVLEKASIKTVFDIGIHLVSDLSGSSLPRYVELIKAFQKKTKKTTLNIYAMAGSYDTLTAFKSIADPTWKITSLNKGADISGSLAFLNMMAEVQIMSILPALILDFTESVDRFIYMMHRNMKGIDYFNEINGLEWSLI
jgi:hypothetical protein